MSEKGSGSGNAFDLATLRDALLKIPAAPPPPPPPVVRGLWYNGKTINLDGWSFESCRFDNCTFILNSPYFKLKNCYIDKTNVVQYGELVLNVVRLFNHQAGFPVPAEFSAIKNSDGTVSIGA